MVKKSRSSAPGDYGETLGFPSPPFIDGGAPSETFDGDPVSTSNLSPQISPFLVVGGGDPNLMRASPGLSIHKKRDSRYLHGIEKIEYQKVMASGDFEAIKISPHLPPARKKAQAKTGGGSKKKDGSFPTLVFEDWDPKVCGEDEATQGKQSSPLAQSMNVCSDKGFDLAVDVDPCIGEDGHVDLGTERLIAINVSAKDAKHFIGGDGYADQVLDHLTVREERSEEDSHISILNPWTKIGNKGKPLPQTREEKQSKSEMGIESRWNRRRTSLPLSGKLGYNHRRGELQTCGQYGSKAIICDQKNRVGFEGDVMKKSRANRWPARAQGDLRSWADMARGPPNAWPSLEGELKGLPQRNPKANDGRTRVSNHAIGDLLSCVDPGMLDKEDEIVFTDEEVDEEAETWTNALVVDVACSTPYFPHFLAFLNRMWITEEGFSVYSRERGFFLIKFPNSEDCSRILETVPWLFDGRILIMKRWKRILKLEKEVLTRIPVWVRLPGLPLLFCSKGGISQIASKVGTPLHSDEATATKKRLTFARVFIEIDAGTEHRDEIKLSLLGGETFVQKIEYEWKPPRCGHCKCFGHTLLQCSNRSNKEWKSKDDAKEGGDKPRMSYGLMGGTLPNSETPQLKSIRNRDRKDVPTDDAEAHIKQNEGEDDEDNQLGCGLTVDNPAWYKMMDHCDYLLDKKSGKLDKHKIRADSLRQDGRVQTRQRSKGHARRTRGIIQR